MLLAPAASMTDPIFLENSPLPEMATCLPNSKHLQLNHFQQIYLLLLELRCQLFADSLSLTSL